MVNYLRINEKLPPIFLFTGYITVFFVNEIVSETIKGISYALLTLLSVFLGFLIVKDVLQRYQEKYAERKKTIENLINRSIEKEKEEKIPIKNKVEECEKRIKLYESLDKFSPKEMTKAGFLSLVFILFTLLAGAFLSRIDTLSFLDPIKSYHFSYVLFLFGLFYFLRLILTFFSVNQEDAI